MEQLVSAAVLAGGRSVRMGRDKRAIQVEGLTLLRRVIDVVSPLAAELLVSCRAEDPPQLGEDAPAVRCVFDERGEGPLAGIEACLRSATHDWLFVVPVDMPGLRTEVLSELTAAVGRQPGRSAAVFRLDGELLPLPMLVHRRTLPALTAQLDRADYRVLHFLEAIDVAAVPLDACRAAELTRNVNTPDDLADAVGPTG